MTDRPSLHEIFMRQARDWAMRGTCPKLRVGAVLVRDGRPVASGYNGAPPGMGHCVHTDLDRPLSDQTPCTNAVHAEANVLAFAARHGQSTLGTTLYCTHSPCSTCAGLLVTAGIERVVYETTFARESGLGIRKLAEGGVEVSAAFEVIRDGGWFNYV